MAEHSRGSSRTRLHQLFSEQGQSPWLDNLKRGYLNDGSLARLVDDGIRGITSNPTILQKAIAASNDYDGQMSDLAAARREPLDAFWDLWVDDVAGALRVLRPVFDDSRGRDGFVSIELAPEIADDTDASIRAARELHRRIDQPNLYVKIPATPAGIPAIRQMIAEGRNINITLIFGLQRYEEVIEAYISGLEACSADLRDVHSVASFFVSRVDTNVDKRLESLGTPEASALCGRTAVAQAKLAYEIFRERFRGQRWDALAERGAHRQRPLWASTSTKNPKYNDLLYVDNLIGPDTVNTMPEATVAAFEEHGHVQRTIDKGLDDAHAVIDALARLDIDLQEVSATLEREGVAAFADSFHEAVAAVADKLLQVAGR